MHSIALHITVLLLCNSFNCILYQIIVIIIVIINAFLFYEIYKHKNSLNASFCLSDLSLLTRYLKSHIITFRLQWFPLTAYCFYCNI